jgi:hypothetical protein
MQPSGSPNVTGASMVDFADWAITTIAATLTLSQIYVQKGSSRPGATPFVVEQGGKI